MTFYCITIHRLGFSLRMGPCTNKWYISLQAVQQQVRSLNTIMIPI